MMRASAPATPVSSTAVWARGDAYEPFVGRWSRLVAVEFLQWVGVLAGARWLDVGCGTGALTAAILRLCEPAGISAVDASAAYVEYARGHVRDSRVSFAVGDAQALPEPDGTANAAVSGLALNFIPAPGRAVREMARVVKPGGVVAAYVWDYADGMQLIRRFWDAAVALDPAARELDEGRRFRICQPAALKETLSDAGLRNVATRAIDVPTRFRDFADYWEPFLGGQGPGPGYAMSLDESHRDALRERVRAGLPIATDGSISLIARAWAVRGER